MREYIKWVINHLTGGGNMHSMQDFFQVAEGNRVGCFDESGSACFKLYTVMLVSTSAV